MSLGQGPMQGFSLLRISLWLFIVTNVSPGRGRGVNAENNTSCQPQRFATLFLTHGTPWLRVSASLESEKALFFSQREDS